MANKTWKSVERAIAAFFPGAKRRGADFGDAQGGKNDVLAEGWSIEVKHSKRPTFGLMVDAVAQAEAAMQKPQDIPIAVIHKKGIPYKDSLVIMRLEMFRDFFINEETTSD